MLLAKLFVVLGIVAAAAASVVRLPNLDVHVHETYVAFFPNLVLWFCSLTSVNFAILYYAAEKFAPTRWSRALGFAHFVLFSLFTVLFTVLAIGAGRWDSAHSEAFGWIVIPWFLGVFSFLLGFILFAVNLVLTIIRSTRARFAVR
jgi:heme/copper-type cytochrome/quinol oxidase subunit 1